MASPFKVFRKNQKAALAVLTVVAMGGFVVLPPILQIMGGRGNQPAARRDVVSTTRYGNLDAQDMYHLRQDRGAVRSFLTGVEYLVREKQRNSQAQTVAQTLLMRLTPNDESIVETWLLANRAEELGVVVDDRAVNSFIELVTEGSVTQDRMTDMLRRSDLPESQLFRLLKHELMAMRLQDLVYTSLVPMTPGERWDYYQRLHRNMSIQLAEVPAERFVASVADPDEATLQEFFDRYKEKEHIPESPDPGFRIPKQIAVEYFKVDYDHLFEPGELEKYYEEHKEEFKRESLPAMEPSDPAPELKGSLPGLDGPQLELPPVEVPAAEMMEAPESEPVKPEADEEPVQEPKESEAKDDAPNPEESEKKPAEEPKPTDDTRNARRSVFQLTAYQAGEKPAEEKPAEEKPAEEKPAEEKPADAPSAMDIDTEKFEPPSEYYTFEEVKSQIQSRLAPDKIERIFRPLQNKMEIYHDANIRFIREQDDEGNASVPEPVRPNFAELAKEAGIEAKKSDGLFSQREAFDQRLDIAQSRVTLGARPVPFLDYAFDSLAELRSARSQDTEGNHYLFWKTAQESERVPELDGEDVEEDVEGKGDEGGEEGEEVREMVVNAWKMIQARDAAQAEADRLASAARAKQESSEEPVSLSTALAGDEGVTVQSTEPFTWFDAISIQLTMMGYGQPRLSAIQIVAPKPKEGEESAEAETVPLVGADFMRAVASLDKGSVGVAWNDPKTVAYVVQMVETTPDTKELESLFLSAADPRQLGIIGNIDRREAFREWMKSLEAEAGLEWHR
jgi:hypothetical protein